MLLLFMCGLGRHCFFPAFVPGVGERYSRTLTYVQNSLMCPAETWLTLAPRSKRCIAHDGGTSNIVGKHAALRNAT